MAGLSTPLRDIKEKLQSVCEYVRLWNNQTSDTRAGKIQDYPKPALFLETLNDIEYETGGKGIQFADLALRVHIVFEFYDANLNDDFKVYDIRDQVVALLHNNTEIAAMGPLHRLREAPDYDHDNLFHYTIDFVGSFTDSKGSVLDPGSGRLVEKAGPTGLQLNLSVLP